MRASMAEPARCESHKPASFLIAPQTMTFQTRALDLARAFSEGIRSDGSSFVMLADSASEWMHDAVRHAHHEELPNDWRFAICRELAHALAEHESADTARDAALDIASDATMVYHRDILRWYADLPSRLDYADSWIADTGTDSVDGGIAGHLYAGQTYCIEQILHGLIDACEAAQAALVEVAA